MHIVHVLLTRRFAGTERHVLELTAAQADRHQVTLILRRKAASDGPTAFAHRVDPRVRVALVDDWLARWPAVPQAARCLRQMSPDIIHAHLGSACRAALAAGPLCPRVATLHIDYQPKQHAGLEGLIAIAPWQLDPLPPDPRPARVQIDNWTAAIAADDDARVRLRQRLGLNPDALLIGAVGRLEPSKGFDLLIEAFRRATLPPGTRLAIVGDGREHAQLARRLPPGATLVGFSDRITDWYAAFDLFVSPSRLEPFGLVLLEAMQAGLPILATQTAGAQHLAPHFGTELVAVDDVAALTTALSTVASSHPTRRSYRMDRFRLDRKLQEIDAFYARLRDRQLAA